MMIGLDENKSIFFFQAKTYIILLLTDRIPSTLHFWYKTIWWLLFKSLIADLIMIQQNDWTGSGQEPLHHLMSESEKILLFGHETKGEWKRNDSPRIRVIIIWLVSLFELHHYHQHQNLYMKYLNQIMTGHNFKITWGMMIMTIVITETKSTVIAIMMKTEWVPH